MQIRSQNEFYKKYYRETLVFWQALGFTHMEFYLIFFRSNNPNIRIKLINVQLKIVSSSLNQ